MASTIKPSTSFLSNDGETSNHHSANGASSIGAISNGQLSNGSKSSEVTATCKKCTNGNKVTVNFPDGTFIFHSQWLHDARCDEGAARNASTALCQQPAVTVRVKSVEMSGKGSNTTVNVTWNDEVSSKFPLPWLRVMAPLVAAKAESGQSAIKHAENKGWTVGSLEIPKVSYKELFRDDISQDELDVTIFSTIDKILSPSFPGIIKIVDLPEANLEDERNHINNLNTIVLKRLFGSVFVHPIRGADQTFNVSSHNHDSTRKIGLPNYDTTQILLPHTDHAFYDNPIQVQGFYGLEGTSLNTWTSPLAALEILKQEFPESYKQLCTTPMAVGRLSRFYGGPLYQATVDTPVTMQPGTDQFKRIRWHPNLTGSLLAPYDSYKEARLAHQRFQEILRRDTQQLKMQLNPGDLYIWDNFRLLHGREKVMDTPRTGVGQTVPEHVVHDRYRALSAARLKTYLDGEWLVHMPMPQLREMVHIYEDGYFWVDG
ncbi:MAG: hypothetical protein L6R35_005109 [Caloplaca aegaea]|nr:MAG: hypothetical protein L6R35_005109 [Caloplaca aegaea]